MIALLTSPSYFALQAYRAATDKVKNALPDTPIKVEFQQFLDKKKIRKDLIILEGKISGVGIGIGTNLFQKANAAILLKKGLRDIDKEACNFVIRHEISHIKNNDAFKSHLLGCIGSIAFLVKTRKAPAPVSLFFTNIAGLGVWSLYTQWVEKKADDFAIENGSFEELLGGRRLLLSIQALKLKERNTLSKKITITSSGNQRFPLLHPTFTSRIQKIELKLARRCINDAEEKQKINNLKKFLIKPY